MASIKNLIKVLLTKNLAKKIIALLLLSLVIYLFRDFTFTFFITFVLAFLFLSIWKFTIKKLNQLLDKIWYPKNETLFFRKKIILDTIIAIEYIIFLTLIIFVLFKLLPQLIKEINELVKTIPFLNWQMQHFYTKLQEISNINQELEWTFQKIIWWDYEVVINVLKKLKTAWIKVFQFFLALILSFILIMDRVKLNNYLKWIKKSNFYFLYDEYKILITKISKSFWLILKAQSLISLINTILTIIWLSIIWKIYLETGTFPYIMTIWLMVFILWFIPVLWVFLSSIPIIIIAYTVWWIKASIAVILLVTFVHMVEAYYLNPKIVSSYFDLPVSLTFIILIVSEHIFWFAGLLIWVSSFYFIMSMLSDADKVIFKKKRKLSNLSREELTKK